MIHALRPRPAAVAATSAGPSVGIVVLKVVLAFVILLVAVIFTIWFERKLIAGMQNRIGPVWAGPWGLLITLADGHQAVLQGRPHPANARRGSSSSWRRSCRVVPAFLTFCIIPLGGDFSNGNDGVVDDLRARDAAAGGRSADRHPAVLAMSSLAVYGVMLAGWSSGSKYPLLGSVRATAQMVSYEAALGHVGGHGRAGGRHAHRPTASSSARTTFVSWNVVATGVVPFIVFMIAGTAELNRPPFDLVEAEQEIVGGYHTEYSSFRFAVFYLAEFLNTVVTMSAIIVTLFLGGPRGLFDIPIIPAVPESILWFLAKLLVLPVRLRLVPGHAAPLPLRPADGSRLEGRSSRSPSRGSCSSPRCAWPTTWAGTGSLVAGVALVVAVGRASACSCWPSGPAARRRAPKGRCSDGSASRASSSRCARSTSRSPRPTRAASRATART